MFTSTGVLVPEGASGVKKTVSGRTTFATQSLSAVRIFILFGSLPTRAGYTRKVSLLEVTSALFLEPFVVTQTVWSRDRRES